MYCTKTICGELTYALIGNGAVDSKVSWGYVNTDPTSRVIVLHSTKVSDLSGSATNKVYSHSIEIWPFKYPTNKVTLPFTYTLTQPCTLTEYKLDRTAVPEVIKYQISADGI
jgi:hypothetical protein